jgi:hypothetical protein
MGTQSSIAAGEGLTLEPAVAEARRNLFSSAAESPHHPVSPSWDSHQSICVSLTAAVSRIAVSELAG